ncbi:MAG: hypothetical protein AAGN66_19285 [Acidobacteriota bacterium]
MSKKAGMINIRNLSVKCGRCGQYQVLTSYQPDQPDDHGDLWNIYTYECDWPPCEDDVAVSRTLLEIPADLDEFARRDPKWHGGKVHAGADARAAEGGD